MTMNKITKLSVLFFGLLVVSLLLVWMNGNPTRRLSSFDKSRFAVADTTQIDQLMIASDQDTLSIARTSDNRWLIDHRYPVDPQLIYLSQRILHAVQIQRPVSTSHAKMIGSELKTLGKKVIVVLKNGESKTFYAGGNPSKTMAYFANEELTDIYIVAIPGYKSYVSGIFELTLGQWRDRLLFASDSRTIQRFSIDYRQPTVPDLSIYFDQKFLAVRGVSSLDTAALMAYIKPLNYFQLNDYLSAGDFPRYDSLLRVMPLATIQLEDIDTSKNKQLTVYPKIPGERFYLLTDQDHQMMVVDQKRIEALLQKPSTFRAQ